MKVIQKGFELSKFDYYKTHLKIINALLPINITDKEIEVLSTFLSLPIELIKEDMFSSAARKKVMLQCDISPGGLSNHLRNMKEKQLLVVSNDSYIVNKALLPDENLQGYNFKLRVKKDE